MQWRNWAWLGWFGRGTGGEAGIRVRVNAVAKELVFLGGDVGAMADGGGEIVWYGGAGRRAQVARTVTRAFAGHEIEWVGLGVNREGGLEFSVETRARGGCALRARCGVRISYRPLPAEDRVVLEGLAARGLVLSQVVGTGGADIFTEAAERRCWGIPGFGVDSRATIGRCS